MVLIPATARALDRKVAGTIPQIGLHPDPTFRKPADGTPHVVSEGVFRSVLFRESRRADRSNGAFMLLRRSALEQVGVFDEGYWMYMEDLDLSYRLGQAGWITFYEPAVRAIHTKGGTTEGRRDARLQIAFHRGMGRFYRKHYAADRSGPFNALIYLGIGLKLAGSLLGGALRDARSGPRP